MTSPRAASGSLNLGPGPVYHRRLHVSLEHERPGTGAITSRLWQRYPEVWPERLAAYREAGYSVYVADGGH